MGQPSIIMDLSSLMVLSSDVARRMSLRQLLLIDNSDTLLTEVVSLWGLSGRGHLDRVSATGIDLPE